MYSLLTAAAGVGGGTIFLKLNFNSRKHKILDFRQRNSQQVLEQICAIKRMVLSLIISSHPIQVYTPLCFQGTSHVTPLSSMALTRWGTPYTICTVPPVPVSLVNLSSLSDSYWQSMVYGLWPDFWTFLCTLPLFLGFWSLVSFSFKLSKYKLPPIRELRRVLGS